MNPYGINAAATVDHAAIAAWNGANERAHAAYLFTLARIAGLCTRGDCERKSGVANLCHAHLQEARSEKRRLK